MPSLFYGAPHVDDADAWAGVARLAAARERDQGHPMDVARAEIARLTAERDEARRALELTCNRNDMVTDLENALVTARAERDQARLELEVTRAEVAKLTAPEALAEELTAARAEIAALRRQVCRLTSGDEIEGDRLCQHHGADVAALAQVARYQVAAVAVATEIGGSLGPVDDDPEERAAAFVRFAEGLAWRVRERVEALEADLSRALHRERRAGDESDERLREMAELLLKDANNE